MALKQRLADFGFESNDDYEFQLRLLFDAQIDHLRCVDISGDSGRRKTAFAQALARALDYPHIIYHDFSLPEPPPAPIVITAEDQDNPQPTEAAPTPFERVIIESCAFSEGARAILVLDQLQAADFRDQARLYHFVRSGEWQAGATSVRANPRNLLLALISEQGLYHSLAKVSFRIWAGSGDHRFEYRPQEFELGAEATALFGALAALCDRLGRTPTRSELQRILDDLIHRVRTEEQLRQSLFGWVEGLDHDALYSPAVLILLQSVLHEARELLGHEQIELGE